MPDIKGLLAPVCICTRRSDINVVAIGTVTGTMATLVTSKIVILLPVVQIHKTKLFHGFSLLIHC